MESDDPKIMYGGRWFGVRQLLRSRGINVPSLARWGNISSRTQQRYLQQANGIAGTSRYSQRTTNVRDGNNRPPIPAAAAAAATSSIEPVPEIEQIPQNNNNDEAFDFNLPEPFEAREDDEDVEMDVGDNVQSDERVHTANAEEINYDDLLEAIAEAGNRFIRRPFLVILRVWAQKYQIPITQMDDLMKLLRINSDYYEFTSLPKSWKTVVKIPKSHPLKTQYDIQEWGDEQYRQRYCYIGIEKRLQQYKHLYEVEGSRGVDDLPPHYEIVANVDGARFGQKGVMKSLWPIQIQVWAVSPQGVGSERRVFEGGNPPHIVGLHHAKKDPKDFCRYLTDFADELVHLNPETPDDEDNPRSITCKLMAMICDTPARRKCKCAKGANAIFPCEKCCSLGTKVGKFFLSVWETLDLDLRVDEEFLEYNYHLRTQVNRVTGELEVVKSPLTKLGYFGMVTGFPVDPMHTVYHGAIKNWLERLFHGSQSLENAFPNPLKKKLQNRLDFLRNFTPAEFRSSRLKPFEHLSNWKAAETRQFILYCAISLFRNIVDEPTYESLCDLVVGLYLIGGASSKPVPERDLVSCQGLFEKFVTETLKRNYSECCPPTVHMLLHVVNDLRFHKCHLERLGAWPYENAMRFILASVKCGFRAMEQIMRREDERLSFTLPVDNRGVIRSEIPIAGKPIMKKQLERTEPYLLENKAKRKSLVFPKCCGDFVLKNSKKNRDCHFVYLQGTNKKKDFLIVKFVDVFNDKVNKQLTMIGQSYRITRLLFTKPCNSSRFYGYVFKDLDPIKRPFAIENVLGKLYAFPSISAFDATDERPEMKKLIRFVSSPRAPCPDFEKVCTYDFDTWEGVAIRHTFDGAGSLY